MVTNLTPDTKRCIQHTQRTWHLLLPWFRRVPTALYYLDKERYGEYVDNRHEKDTGFINWHARKRNIQDDYQQKLSAQGPILRDIYVARVAEGVFVPADFLNWLSWTWQLYGKNLRRDDFQDDGFVRFCQSDLIFDEELTEPDCYGKNRYL